MEYGIIKNDWSNIQSKYDLDLRKIDHWCLSGHKQKKKNESCKCEDPLTPLPRNQVRSWVEAYKDNLKRIEKYNVKTNNSPTAEQEDLDIIFFGESIVEEMDGKFMGIQKNDQLREIQSIFIGNFDKKHGNANYQGLALGIAGDTSNNALWRLLEGEMPEYLNPKIWWITLGMNDLRRMQCSEEIVILGILRIVEEILNKKPDAYIVINSLLPMADMTAQYHDIINNNNNDEEEGNRKMMERYNENQKQRDPSSNNIQSLLHHRPLTSIISTLEEENNNPIMHNDEKNHRKQQQKDSQFKTIQKDKEHLSLLNNKADYSDKHVEQINSFIDEVVGDIREEKRKKQMNGDNEEYNPIINNSQNRISNKRSSRINFFGSKKGKQQQNIPLWTSIYAINKELEKFCNNSNERNHRISFFDATEIFTQQVDYENYILLSDRISSNGHPTTLGYQMWEDAMLVHIDEIFEKIRNIQNT